MMTTVKDHSRKSSNLKKQKYIIWVPLLVGTFPFGCPNCMYIPLYRQELELCTISCWEETEGMGIRNLV